MRARAGDGSASQPSGATVGPMDGRRMTALAAVVALTALLAGCAAGAPASSAPTGRPSPATSIALPPPGAPFDYQLGGAYAPADGVQLVGRDSTDEPSGRYDVCYVNGFQTQPQESAAWLRDAPQLLLHRDGRPFVDPGWPDEYLLDVSTPANRAAILQRLTPTLERCAKKGFDAIEIDNLDSWTRSHGAFGIDAAIAMARAYADLAHSLHLAIGQKNGAGHSAQLRREVGFDFAITEECLRYRECGDYLAAYGQRVYDIEYDGLDCAASGRPESVILRDHDLSTPSEDGYVRRSC
jgi:hypothetical protein